MITLTNAKESRKCEGGEREESGGGVRKERRNSLSIFSCGTWYLTLAWNEHISNTFCCLFLIVLQSSFQMFVHVFLG